MELPQLTQVGADGRPVPLTYGPPVQHWQPPRTVNPRGEPPMTFNPNPPARTELAGGPMFAMPEYDDVPGLRQFDDALRRGGEAVGDMFFQPRPTQTPAPTPVDFMPRRPQFPMNTNFGQPQQPMPMWPPYSPTFIPQPQVSEEFARKGFEQYLYGVDPTTPPEQIINNPAAAGSGQSYYDKRALQNRGYTPQQAVAGMQAGRGAQQPMTDPQSIFQLQAWRDTAGRQPSPMPPEPPPVTAEQIRGQNPEQLRAAGMGFPMPGAPPTSAPAAQELLALRGGMRPGMGSPASDVRTAPPAMWQPDMGTVPRGAEFVKQREERLAKEKQLSDFLGARQLPYRPLGSVSETGGVPASDTAQAELARLARYSGNPQVETPGKMSFADYKKMAQTSAPFAETQATLPTWVGQGGTRIVDQKKYEDSQKRRQDTESQRALNLRANKRGVAPWQQQVGETMTRGGTLTEDQRMGAFPGYIQGQNEAAQRQTWERVMSEQSRSRANAGKFESLARAYGMAATPEARKGIMDLMNALDQPPGTTAAPPGNNITPAPGATKPAVPIATAIETMRNMGMTPEQMREQLPTMGYSLADVQGQTGFNILPWAMGLHPFNPAGLSGQGLISKMLPEQTAQSILEAFPEWLSPAKETRRRKTAQAILKGSK